MADPSVLAALDHLMATYRSVGLDRFRNSAQGHWINEAFVIRLWAIVESHKVASENVSIAKELPGAEDMDICRRLRNELSHATGNVLDSNSRKLEARMRSHYGLGDQIALIHDKFILSKDTVLRPMFAAVRKYCAAKVAGHG